MSKSSKSRSSKSRAGKAQSIKVARAKTKASKDTFLGMPGSWTWPGWGAIHSNMWNPKATAVAFPPKVFGFGWSINFAYSTIKGKPFWARVGMFIISLLVICIVMWALLAVLMILYFFFTSGTK